MIFEGVPEKALNRLLEYLDTKEDTSNRTDLGEYITIIEEEGDFFPFCHALIANSYLQDDLLDLRKCKEHIDIALQQDPCEVMALCESIAFQEISRQAGANKTSKLVNGVKGIPYLGMFTTLNGLAAIKLAERQTANSIGSLVNRICSALPKYLDLSIYSGLWIIVADRILNIQGAIRDDKLLMKQCGNSLARELYALPWKDIPIEDADEKKELDKMVRRIRGEAI